MTGTVVSAAAAPLHMGAPHPVETALVLLVAFGPFVVLAVVTIVTRRRRSEPSAQAPSSPESPAPGGAVDRID